MSRRKGLAVAVVVLLMVSVGFILLRPSASAGQQFQTTWDSLVKARLSPTLKDQPSEQANRLQTFAAALGRVSLPSSDASDAHKLIRDAVDLAGDYGNTTYSPAQPERYVPCSADQGLVLCGDFPAIHATLNYPSSFQSDSASLTSDARVLFADLGGS